jgi:hypothetical protein
MNNVSAAGVLRTEVIELAAEQAPRRFALGWIDTEADDGGILAWGLQTGEDESVVFSASGARVLGRFSSAEQARRLFSRSGEVVLVWLDGRSQ